ncbi:MAG TPA: M20/M25/M40 family metallo-hydrolase [Planctomycetota bacterium]|nr:M20/M25/M40 family metallo-hydrolase [Planctomycetota bacterium]
MRLFDLRLASLLLFVAPALAFARQSDAEKLIALGKSENHVMEHLDHLANRIGPRLTGSDGFTNACAWTREQFESFGLANARLEKWGEFPVGFNRGPSFGQMVTPEARVLHFATNAWTAGTRGPTLGPALLAPTDEKEFEALRPKLAGAWIITPSVAPSAERRPEAAGPRVVEAGAPAPGASEGKTPGMVEREFRAKLEKAYDEGGVAGTIRSGRGDLVLTGGSSRVDFDKLPKRASITLLAADFDVIVDKLHAGQRVDLEFDIRNWFERGPIELSNVIAEIPGTEKPDEIVIVSGHLDSWDGATGTTDNGTGCATTMEAARLIVKAGVKPKRTIRFILWGGEEQGLLGSAAYVKAHKDEMEKISAVLVHDGGTNFCAGITATPPMMQPFESIFAPVVNLDPELPFKVREVKGLSGGGSDHNSFLAANVPGFFWSQRGRANYNHTHHTQWDTFEAAIPEYQKNSAIVIAVGAVGIANLPELLSRENLRAPSGGGGRRLGLQLDDEMKITELSEDGLAVKAGLLVGDKLVKIGEAAVADTDEMRSALREGPAKTKVVVLRKGKEVVAAIEFPADAGGGVARRLGVRFSEGSLTIDVITPGSAGDQAGFVTGDTLVKIADKIVASAQELAEALSAASGSVKVTLRRDGKELVLNVPLN